MGKRFTCTEKWKKVWFRKLSPIHKCFWTYLCDNCNHAGVWEVDFEAAEWFIGKELDLKQLKADFSKQYVEIAKGKKWFVRDFVEFQYGTLNPDNRAHLSVINILKKEGAYKGLTSSLEGRKDKDMDKDKVKEKDKDKEATPLQEIVNFYFSIKDYTDKDWIKQNYARYTKVAKRLLVLADSKGVCEAITKGKAYFEGKKLDWTLETIEKRWNELKESNEKGEECIPGTNISKSYLERK